MSPYDRPFTIQHLQFTFRHWPFSDICWR